MMTAFDASELLRRAAKRHKVDFAVLVAETSLWASPLVHKRIIEQTGSAAWYPDTRRGRVAQGESRGRVVDGVRFDDNTYANQAVKKAIGIDRANLTGFETCHVWPGTCYDTRYHTAVANLVLIPRALAAFSDHDPHIQSALQYRAFELYAWHPAEVQRPVCPDSYPITWMAPLPPPPDFVEPEVITSGLQPQLERKRRLAENSIAFGSAMDAEEKAFVESRIELWAAKPNQNVHKIIAIVLEKAGGISRSQLALQVQHATGSKSPSGAIASLLTSKGNAYGRALLEKDGLIRIHPAVEGKIRRYRWYK